MALSLRCRMNGEVIEMWDGEPGEAESDLLASFHKIWLPEVKRQLDEIHKWPKLNEYNGWHYPIGKSK